MTVRLLLAVGCWFVLAVLPAAAAEPSPEALEFFEKKIRPLLVNHCQECHGVRRQRGGLRLDSRAAMLKGGDNGPVVVPGEPDRSRLIRAVGYLDTKLQMPLK